MENLNKNAFIETEIKTIRNERLENAINESKEQAKRIKGFANSENKFVSFLAWLFVIIIIFFAFPILLTGIISKGMRKKEQTMLWTAVILIVIINFVKNTLF